MVKKIVESSTSKKTDLETVTLTSSFLGDNSEYVVVKQAPTKFRGYGFEDGKNYFLVRGLRYKEVLSLSKINMDETEGEIDYQQLAQLYSDAIRFSTPDFTIRDLEQIDFNILVTICNILTLPNFSWTPKVSCSNKLPDGKYCGADLNRTITLDDFEFEDPKITTVPISMMLDGKELMVGVLSVGDLIAISEYTHDHPDVDRNIVEYACLIKTIDGEKASLSTRIKIIERASLQVIEQIKDLFDSLVIPNKPIKVVCPVCHQENILFMDFASVRIFPSVKLS